MLKAVNITLFTSLFNLNICELKIPHIITHCNFAGGNITQFLISVDPFQYYTTTYHL